MSPQTTPPTPEYEFKTQPYKHQSFEGALAHWYEEYWGFLLEMGAGKSKIFIDNCCILFELGEIQAVLITAPKGVYANWVNKEIPTHMPERIRKNARIHMWKGGHTKTEKMALEWLMEPGEGLRILVVNDEAIAASKKLVDVLMKFVRAFLTMIGVDESSRLKNPNAVKAKLLHDIGKYAEFRRIMTGTPVAQSPLDLWSQFEFLTPAAFGFRNFYAFRSKFAILEKTMLPRRDPKGKVFMQATDLVVGHRHTDQLSQMVATMATVLRKEDCLDLPPKVYEDFEVELTDEQLKHYAEIKRYAVTMLETGQFVTATQVITQILRLHQVVCGHVKDDNGTLTLLPTKRPQALLDLLEGINDKTIVWANYRQDIDRIMEVVTKAGYKAVRYDGETSAQDRAEAIARFQGECLPNDQANLFVGTQSAGGYGITLTAARAVVYYSNNYDLEKRLQSEDRAHRIGQTRSVTYVDMIARGTVDEKIIAALKRKEQLANLIMDGPARIRDLFGD